MFSVLTGTKRRIMSIPVAENRRVLCPDCDFEQRVPRLSPGEKAYCSRCGHKLDESFAHGLNLPLALAITAFVLYLIALNTPFLTMRSGSIVHATSLTSSVVALARQEMMPVAILVSLTSLVIPLLQTLFLLYLLLPLQFGYCPKYLETAYRYYYHLREWSMVDVFFLGVLVALIKLSKMAEIIPGEALWMVLLLMFVLAAADRSIERERFWATVRRCRS
jgi:paraquat-inducible protein A